MPDGGFLVKFNGKEAFRCYTVAFYYHEWQYMINEKERKELPKDTKTITVEVEAG